MNTEKTLAKICLYAILCLTLWACGSHRAAPTATTADTLREARAEEYVAIQRQLEAIRQMRSETKETVIRDSTVIVLSAEGQTISRDTYRSRDTSKETAAAIERQALRMDSVISARLDSIAASSRAEMPQPAERQLTRWERLRQDLFAPVCAIALALALWTLRKPLLALARRLI